MFKISKENEKTGERTLQEKNLNIADSQTKRQGKSDQLLTLVQEELTEGKRCDLVSIILGDPLLRELNMSLEREAQQQKKSRLLESFPLRYQNLIHTELLYQKSQNQLQEYQKESREVIVMLNKEKEDSLDQINFLRNQLNQKDQELILLKQNHSRKLAEIQEELSKQLKESVERGRVRVSELQGQLGKLNIEKEHLGEFLEELKEQCDTLKEENQRLVTIITQKDTVINELNSTLTKQKQMYQETKQQFMTQLVDSQLKFEKIVDSYIKEKNQIEQTTDGLKIRVSQLEEENLEKMREAEELQSHHFDQLQELRRELLESVRAKNELEEENENLQQRLTLSEQEYLGKVNSFMKQLKDKQTELKRNSEETLSQISRMNSSRFEAQAIWKENSYQLQNKLSLKSQQLAKCSRQIQVVTGEKQKLEQRILELQLLYTKLEALYNQEIQKKEKAQGKQIRIHKLQQEVKGQIVHFQSILQEQQTKIGECRTQILTLRSKLREMNNCCEQYQREIEKLREDVFRCEREEEQMGKREVQYILKQKELKKQLELTLALKSDASCQYEVSEDNDNIQLLKEMQSRWVKVDQKYKNAVQELQTIRLEHQSDNKESQELICSLRNEIMLLKSRIKDESPVERQVEVKIQQLTVFYEQKMDEERERLRKGIGKLRQEIKLLKEEIDLKKIIELEVYQDILECGALKVQFLDQVNFV